MLIEILVVFAILLTLYVLFLKLIRYISVKPIKVSKPVEQVVISKDSPLVKQHVIYSGGHGSSGGGGKQRIGSGGTSHEPDQVKKHVPLGDYHNSHGRFGGGGSSGSWSGSSSSNASGSSYSSSSDCGSSSSSDSSSSSSSCD